MELSDLARQGLAAAMLIGFITMLIRGDVVLGREYKAALDDRDYWRRSAERSLDLTETAIEPHPQRRSANARH